MKALYTPWDWQFLSLLFKRKSSWVRVCVWGEIRLLWEGVRL